MRSAIFIGVVLAAVACSPALISRERAIELATAHAPANATIHGAAIVERRQFGEGSVVGGGSPDDQVWAVLFHTVLGNPCPIDASGSPASGCPADVPATFTVVLDGRTGEFLFAVGPVP